MPTPPADIDVDEVLVRRLLTAQHPDLAALPLRLVANGWDNAVFRLGDALAVRVPRRESAAHLIRHEQQVLPAIAARVPVAVPAPVRIGVPQEGFAWHWFVVRWFEGRVVADADLRNDADLASALAAFVGALHVPAPGDAPVNAVRGVPLHDRAEVVTERLVSGLVPHAAASGAVWTEALAAPAWAGPAVWLHGDLHPANLIERDGRHERRPGHRSGDRLAHLRPCGPRRVPCCPRSQRRRLGTRARLGARDGHGDGDVRRNRLRDRPDRGRGARAGAARPVTRHFSSFRPLSPTRRLWTSRARRVGNRA